MCGDPGGAGGGATGRGGSHGFEGDDAAMGSGSGSSGGGVGGWDYSAETVPTGRLSPGDTGSSATVSGGTGSATGSVGARETVDLVRAAELSLDQQSTLNPEPELAAAANVSLAQQDSVNAAMQAAETDIAQTQDSESKVAKVLGFVTSLFISKPLGEAVEWGMNQLISLGMNEDSANSAVTSVTNGGDPDSVAGGLGPGDFTNTQTGGGANTGTGGANTGGSVANNDPTSYEFWDNFVNEWAAAKGMYQEDDEFKKANVDPAVKSYQDLLSGSQDRQEGAVNSYKDVLADLTNQATTGTGAYKPTTFGMGDFRTSFVPKSGLMTAEDLGGYGKDALKSEFMLGDVTRNTGSDTLRSELARIDVMQPNKGNLDYLDELKKLAVWKSEQDQRRWLAEEGFDVQSDRTEAAFGDKGSWLDVIKDVVQIGDTVGDAWDNWV